MKNTIPPLDVQYPITIHTRRLLIGDTLEFKMLVPGDENTYTYSMQVVYLNSPQRTVPLYSPRATFKLI
jgi:hypothetical protein